MQWSHDKCFAPTISAGFWIPSDAPCTLVVLPGRTLSSQTPCPLISANIARLCESVAHGKASELHQTPSVPPQRQVSCPPRPDSSKGSTSYWLCLECMNSSKIIGMSVFLCGQPLAPQAIHFESPSSNPQARRLWPYLNLRWQLTLKMDWSEASCSQCSHLAAAAAERGHAQVSSQFLRLHPAPFPSCGKGLRVRYSTSTQVGRCQQLCYRWRPPV